MSESGVLGSPEAQGYVFWEPHSQGTREGSEILETSGEEDLETPEPDSQVLQVPVEQVTERPGGPRLGRLALE